MQTTTIRTSEQTNELDAALALAQGEMEAAPKSSLNPHFKSHYSNLAACKAAARPALTKHGLSVSQGILTDLDRAAVGVATRLAHKSGQWFIHETWCKPKGIGPQDVGSAGTYLKRYGYCATVGLTSEEDDDGQSAQPQPQPSPVATFSGSMLSPSPSQSVGPFPKSSEETYELESSIPDISAGEWEVPFGKYKGKKLRTLTANDIRSYRHFLREAAKKDGKPPSIFIDKADAYLSALQSSLSPGLLTNVEALGDNVHTSSVNYEDIPF